MLGNCVAQECFTHRRRKNAYKILQKKSLIGNYHVQDLILDDNFFLNIQPTN